MGEVGRGGERGEEVKERGEEVGRGGERGGGREGGGEGRSRAAPGDGRCAADQRWSGARGIRARCQMGSKAGGGANMRQ